MRVMIASAIYRGHSSKEWANKGTLRATEEGPGRGGPPPYFKIRLSFGLVGSTINLAAASSKPSEGHSALYLGLYNVAVNGR